jgi:ABC-type bacteriocin/lantibiotic exporter with double-glycine peptidase domain
MSRRRVLLATGLCACLGCAHAAPAPPVASEGNAVSLVEVPFFAGPGGDSGAAVLASVLAHFGVPQTLDSIRDGLPRASGGGVLALDLALYPRRFGLRTAFGRGDVAAITRQLADGRPVIVLLDDGNGSRYALVVAVDPSRETVLIYTAERSDVAVRLGDFEAAWARAGCWMIAIAPNGRGSQPLPVQAL